MHIVHLGFLRDVVASCLVDMLESGTWLRLVSFFFAQGQCFDAVAISLVIPSYTQSAWESLGDLCDYVGLPDDSSNDLILYRIGSMAQIWAKEQKLELSIRPLTENSLNYTSSSYPELDSQVKAARAKVLFEFVCKICLDVDA